MSDPVRLADPNGMLRAEHLQVLETASEVALMSRQGVFFLSTGAERTAIREHGSGRPPERGKSPLDGLQSRLLKQFLSAAAPIWRPFGGA